MAKSINIKYNLKEYLKIAITQKGLFILATIGIILIESTYLLDKFLFKVLVDDATSFTANLLSREALITVLLVIAITFSINILMRILLKFYTIHVLNRLAGRMVAKLKQKYFYHIISLDQSFHSSHKTGSLISRLTRAGSATERLTDVIVFSITPLLFQSVAVILSIAYFSIAPAIVLLITAVAFLSFSFFVQIKQQPNAVAANDREDDEKAVISDMFSNIDSIKYFGKETFAKAKFDEKMNAARFAAIKNWDYYRTLDAGQHLILGAGLFFLLYFPIKGFLAGELSLGTIVFIFTIYGNLVGPLFAFAGGMREFYRTMADYESLFAYGKISKTIIDKKNAKKAKVTKGKIVFDHVSFSYGARKILPYFDLTIKPNEKIALIGHSGSGKTTLIKLLYRLYDVQEGAIKIDGTNIRNFKQESLRSELSIVPQEAVLFDDTIYNNIKFSRPSAKRSEVLQAIKFAQLDRTILNLPNKEETIVGERGVRLSGGEKQRVSIARAILADKKILVLDEATSALDSKTEHEIQRDLYKLMKGRTSIVIAHRLSTIMYCDRIIVMEKGKIVEMGTHQELINKESKYKELWQLQRGGYIE